MHTGVHADRGVAMFRRRPADSCFGKQSVSVVVRNRTYVARVRSGQPATRLKTSTCAFASPGVAGVVDEKVTTRPDPEMYGAPLSPPSE